MIERNNPAEARKLLDKGSEETLKANLPLAVESLDKVSEEIALRLAEWYIELANKAGVGGRELMELRARDYYLAFFKLHAGRDDPLAIRAALGLKKLGGTVPDPPPEAGVKPKPVAIQPDGELTNLRLAEFVVYHQWVGQVTPREVGNARLVSDLTPLARLANLQSLDMNQAAGVKDLSPLARLAGLRSLNLAGTGVEDLSPLAGLKNLSSLNLSWCANLSDLSPLPRLASLTSLDVSRCAGLKDWASLAKLTKLKALNLTGCTQLTAGDLETLQQALPNCKIFADMPK